MKYTENGDEIAITMTHAEHCAVMLLLGEMTGVAVNCGNDDLAYRVLRLANYINSGNPDFRPYELPQDET